MKFICSITNVSKAALKIYLLIADGETVIVKNGNENEISLPVDKALILVISSGWGGDGGCLVDRDTKAMLC